MTNNFTESLISQIAELQDFYDRTSVVGEIAWNLTDSYGTKWLGMEWIVQNFIRMAIEPMYPRLIAVIEQLIERGHTSREECYTYNDLDCNVWVEQFDGTNLDQNHYYTCMIHESQGRPVLFVLESYKAEWWKTGELTIYQCYEEYDLPTYPKLEDVIQKIKDTDRCIYFDTRDNGFCAKFKPVDQSVIEMGLDSESECNVELTNFHRVRWALFDIETTECAFEDE